MYKQNLDKLRDMTEKLNLEDDVLKKTKDILEKALSIGTDGFWDWHVGSGKNGSEDYEYLSPRFKEQLGYEDYELANVPSSWQKLMNPDDLKVMFNEVTKHFESKGTYSFSCVGRYNHKSGNEVIILCRGSVVEWDNDLPKRMIGTHTDISKYSK